MGTDTYVKTPKEKEAEEAVNAASSVTPKRKLTKKERKAKEAKEKKSDFEFLYFYNFVIIWIENMMDLQSSNTETFLSRIFWILRVLVLFVCALVLIIGASVGAIIAIVKLVLIYAVLEALVVGILYITVMDKHASHWAFDDLRPESDMRAYMFETHKRGSELPVRKAYERFQVLVNNNIVKNVRF